MHNVTRKAQDEASGSIPLFDSPGSRPATTTTDSSPRSTSSPSIPGGSISQSASETDSETGSDSFLSSRESIQGTASDGVPPVGDDVVPGKDAVREGMVIGDDGIAVGDDAFTYSRRSSPPPVSVSPSPCLLVSGC